MIPAAKDRPQSPERESVAGLKACRAPPASEGNGHDTWTRNRPDRLRAASSR
jgi:hypothetical protein